MDKYTQQQHKWESRRRNPVIEGRRTKMRKEEETTESNNTVSNVTNPNSTSFSLPKQPQPHRGGQSRGRSPLPGFNLHTDDTPYKTSGRSPKLPHRRPVNENKIVNWRLACFMSNEYLNSGTILGRPWPPQDPNPKCRNENKYKSKPMSTFLDKDNDEIRREKEGLYHTLAGFVREGDVHLPGIVNPSQLASWLGFNQ